MKKYKQDKKICVKDNTKEVLDKLGNKGETYDDVIKKLIVKIDFVLDELKRIKEEELNKEEEFLNLENKEFS